MTTVITREQGFPGLNPEIVRIVTTATLAQVTTAGWYNQAPNNTVENLSPTDTVLICYSYGSSSQANAFFSVSITKGVVTLSLAEGSGITLPTIANHIATYTNTSGALGEDPATAISGGNIQAGLSGTAGALTSFPATASTGSLSLTGVANSGNYNIVFSNVSMGQASVISSPDPVNAIGRFLVGATATPFVSGNFPQNSGTGGLMIDSGLSVANVVSKAAANTFSGTGSIVLPKVNGPESSNAVTASGVAGVITTSSLTTAAGSSYAITWTNTRITSTSVVLFSISGGTNTTQNITFTCVPGDGTATLTIYNNTAATALNGTIFINYVVL